jgi:hypothetical protein
LISKLEAKLATAEENAKDQVNTGLEQARAADQKQIKKLRSDLKQIHQSTQTNQAQVS